MADAFSVLKQSGRAQSRKRKRTSDAELQALIVQSLQDANGLSEALGEDDSIIDRTLVRGGGRSRQPRRTGGRRERATTKAQHGGERPGSLTFERCEHMLIAMSYFGLSATRSFINTIAGRDHPDEPESALLSEGVHWADACMAHDILSSPGLALMQTLGQLAEARNPSESATVYSKLHDYMKMMLSVCTFVAEPVQPGFHEPRQCAIGGKPVKPSDKPSDQLIRVAVSLYEPSADAAGEDYLHVRVRSARPLVFHVAGRYATILFGVWYFHHLPILLGANCATWVAWARSLPAARRHAEFPGIATMSDAALARLFVKQTHGDCLAMFQQMVSIAQTIDKRNQEYSKQLA